MTTIPDAEKARRYRRKLVDLSEKVNSYFKAPTRARHEALLDEANTVRTQLDVEERLGRPAFGDEPNPLFDVIKEVLSDAFILRDLPDEAGRYGFISDHIIKPLQSAVDGHQKGRAPATEG